MMTMSSFYFSFPLSVLLLLSFCSSAAHSSFQDDRSSLLSFKKLITSDPNQSMADWSPDIPLCNWSFVTCSRRHAKNRVVSLTLSSMDLRGPISPSLGNLSFLRSLDLSQNALYGLIPPQLGQLFRLKKLNLSCNQLEGSIPSQLGNCGNLSYLELSDNNLSGIIPPELGSLAGMQQLYLSSNILTGKIPSSLGNLSALLILDFRYNFLTGTIPSQLGLLTRLQELYLYYNELSGNIPTFWANMSALTDLHLAGNLLTGSIPQELGLLTSMQTFSLAQNKLSGNIPIVLSNMYNLTTLYLWGNQLTGHIPKSIGNCSKLQVLSLQYNKLTGSVPIELGRLSLLEKLSLHFNQLDSGSTITMPFLTALTNCSRLQKLHLTYNKLSGVLPVAIGQLSTYLSYLSLSNNKIKGFIPPQINKLSSLTFLNLSGNILNGSIPQLGSLENLERLDLGNNKLQGNIPDDFEHLHHLGLLDISRNLLSGNIPQSLALLKQLRTLLFHHNQLSGSIPSHLGDCINLELLDLSHNKFTGRIPREIGKLFGLQFYLNLSWNLLEGPLPLEIGKITMVQAIDISSNKLTGVIPSSLGSCVGLQSFNLSQNGFYGSIPNSFDKLKSLVNLDLSYNYLSGTIPVTLQKLNMLQYLNLSFNNLTGEIAGGFLVNQSMEISLIGNPGLCGPQAFGLFACPTPRGHSTIVRKAIFPLSGTIAFIICCLVLIFLWRRNMNIQNIDFSLAIFQKLEHPRISYQELHIATNGFIQDNLLGTGNFGSVYRGTLSDGTFIAVKVLQLQNNQVEKSFKVECDVLKNVRHRNLVKIITSCSNPYFKALVFKFMSNGSLEKHLYPSRDDNNGDVCELGMKTRLDIAIDVAHAIEYLHHDSFVQIVHCDIKPNNILLDEDMSGHVTDFGIARLIGESSNASATSTLALKGSVGYIAPEYGLADTISTQGDVYSYGILLLEMLTRRKPVSDMFVEDLNLHKWVNLAFPNQVKRVIDSSLFNEMDRDEFEDNNIYKCLVSLLHVGLICSKDSPQERPTMRVVVTMLKSIKEDLKGNTAAPHQLRQSISSFLSNENETKNDAHVSDDQSSTF